MTFFKIWSGAFFVRARKKEIMKRINISNKKKINNRTAGGVKTGAEMDERFLKLRDGRQ